LGSPSGSLFLSTLIAMDFLYELAERFPCTTLTTQRDLGYIPKIYSYFDGGQYSDEDWECLEFMRWKLAFHLAAGDWLTTWDSD
jgi:hypothetical protein